MENPLYPKFSAELCLVIMANGPKERSLYQPACDYLFEQWCTPIEARSPGEALIHTRQAKFSLIIMPDDDQELIKKIKAPDGLNSQTAIIAVSSTDEITASTKELLDSHVVQEVVHASSGATKFQEELLSAIRQQLHFIRQAENGLSIPNSQNPTSAETQAATTSTFQTIPTALPEFPGVINLPRQPCFLPQYPMGGQGGEYPVAPIHPYSLYPPMVVPYSSLAAGRMPPMYTPDYMMPRIVSFRNQQDQAFLNLLGPPPGSSALPGHGNIHHKDSQSSNNAAPSVESPQGIKPLVGDKDSEKAVDGSKGGLPGIKNFLDALGPVEDGNSKRKEEKEQQMKEDVHEKEVQKGKGATEDIIPAKKAKLDIPSEDLNKTPSMKSSLDVSEHGAGKSPLAVAKARPYFVNIGEEMEEMAFDPKAKPADRHNAKERHRRVRLTKAADFFRDTLPCMSQVMDKATVFHLTLYYLIYLRNALHQHEPQLVKTLHKTYKEEWETHFNLEDPIE